MDDHIFRRHNLVMTSYCRSNGKMHHLCTCECTLDLIQQLHQPPLIATALYATIQKLCTAEDLCAHLLEAAEHSSCSVLPTGESSQQHHLQRYNSLCTQQMLLSQVKMALTTPPTSAQTAVQPRADYSSHFAALEVVSGFGAGSWNLSKGTCSSGL